MSLRKRNYSNIGKKRSKLPWVLLAIVVLAAIALGVAWFWQDLQTRPPTQSPIDSPPEILSESSEKPPASSESPSSLEEEETAVPSTEESSEEESDASVADASAENSPSTIDFSADTTFARREAYPYSLAQSETPVDATYFQDAIFLGDSISTGIPLYLRPVLGDVLLHAEGEGWQKKPALVAETGISPRNALTKEVFDLNGTKVPMLEKAASFGPRSKVYLLIGGNSLGYELAPFIEGYRELLQAVKEQYPDAQIYVQSITPVTSHATERYPSLGTGDINAKINEYNLSIMNLAQEMGVYYLDIASVFVDSEGKLPREASPSDGVHFGADYYYRWYHYLINHTA